jgi:hypothetical protein
MLHKQHKKPNSLVYVNSIQQPGPDLWPIQMFIFPCSHANSGSTKNGKFILIGDLCFKYVGPKINLDFWQ